MAKFKSYVGKSISNGNVRLRFISEIYETECLEEIAALRRAVQVAEIKGEIVNSKEEKPVVTKDMERDEVISALEEKGYKLSNKTSKEDMTFSMRSSTANLIKLLNS